jgi:hypothetical protein
MKFALTACNNNLIAWYWPDNLEVATAIPLTRLQQGCGASIPLQTSFTATTSTALILVLFVEIGPLRRLSASRSPARSCRCFINRTFPQNWQKVSRNGPTHRYCLARYPLTSAYAMHVRPQIRYVLFSSVHSTGRMITLLRRLVPERLVVRKRSKTQLVLSAWARAGAVDQSPASLYIKWRHGRGFRVICIANKKHANRFCRPLLIEVISTPRLPAARWTATVATVCSTVETRPLRTENRKFPGQPSARKNTVWPSFRRSRKPT